MKRYLLILPLILVLFACATRGTFTSIAASEQAGQQAYAAYTDGVITGTIKTNDYPAVSQAFNLFQLSVRTAIAAAQGNTNAPATPQVKSAQQNLLDTISKAKTP